MSPYSTDIYSDGRNYWLGLNLPPTVVIPTGGCLNSRCNGVLRWDDGTPFAYKPELMGGSLIEIPAGGGSANDCFVFNGTSYIIERVDCNVVEHSACHTKERCPSSFKRLLM